MYENIRVPPLGCRGHIKFVPMEFKVTRLRQSTGYKNALKESNGQILTEFTT